MKMKSIDPIDQLAEKIAAKLFTNGAGRKADRLVLFQEHTCGDLARNLGGFSEKPMADQIADVLRAALNQDHSSNRPPAPR
jgi:hypothetical protein